LGAFRRELLLHLAIREAVARSGSRSVPATGLPWKPKEALRPGVELTPTLTVKISNALAALEELGYVKRFREAGERGATRTVKVTRRGVREAVEITQRGMRSESEVKRAGGPLDGVREDPVAWAESVAHYAEQMEALAKKPGIVVETLTDGTSDWRKAVLIVRSYVRSNPGDQRAAEALRRVERFIPPFVQTQEGTDRHLFDLALEAKGQAVYQTTIENPSSKAWLRNPATFDLSGGLQEN